MGCMVIVNGMTEFTSKYSEKYNAPLSLKIIRYRDRKYGVFIDKPFEGDGVSNKNFKTFEKARKACFRCIDKYDHDFIIRKIEENYHFYTEYYTQMNDEELR